jgi:uncharacterized protein (TIRG00374 family)
MDRKMALPLAPVGTLRLRPIRPNGLAARMAVGLVVAVILVVTFARLVNLSSVKQRLEHLSIGLAVLCGLVFLGAYVVRALRWRCFLAAGSVSVPRVIAIYQVATFVNWLLPIRGGELVKCILLRRLNNRPISETLPTVAMDKTMDLLPAFGLIALLPFLPLHLSQPLWVLLLTVLVVLVSGALFLGLAAWRRSLALALLAWLMARFPRAVRQRVEPFAMRFVDALLALVMRPRLLAVAAAYTAVAVCLDALFCLLAFQAVGTSIAFPVVLYGYTFYNLAYILPTPPGQIGSNELVGLGVFTGLLQVDKSAVGAMFLFSHPWTAILMVASGLLCLSAMGLNLRSTLTVTQEPSAGARGHAPARAPARVAGVAAHAAPVRRGAHTPRVVVRKPVRGHASAATRRPVAAHMSAPAPRSRARSAAVRKAAVAVER